MCRTPLRWLRLSKSKRLEQILTLSPTQSDNEKVVVTESTMTQAFELLIAIARSEKKTEEAQQLLTRMAERVGSTGKQSEASKLDLLKEIFAQTLSGQTINEKQVEQARSLTDSVLSGISSCAHRNLVVDCRIVGTDRAEGSNIAGRGGELPKSR